MVSYDPAAIRRIQREFSSGSLETPDAESRYLENLGYYRKHIATDSTCLFRAVSEFEHGIQMYHDSVRLMCVEFMRKHDRLFAMFVKGPIKTYLAKLALTRTYGSLLELRALAMLYKADVILYEPYTSGRWFYRNMDETKKVWRLFVCRVNHFDSVYPLEYMQEAAFCQSLVYEVLYKEVFQVPDVEYAVERMLYDPENITTVYGKDDQGRPIAITADGRQLVMSRRENTKCILSNYQLCHFHNNVNFPKVRRFFMENGNEAGYRLYGPFSGSNYQVRAGRSNPLLMVRDISCIRQLLNIGVMPFPYKVAKALDPFMYRNIEFDVWNLAHKALPCETERAGDHTVHNFEPNPIDRELLGEQIIGNSVELEGQAQESFYDHTCRVQVQHYDNVVNRQYQMDHAVVVQQPPATAFVNMCWAPLIYYVPMPLLLIPVPYWNWAQLPFAVAQRESTGGSELSEADVNESQLVLQQPPLQGQSEHQQQQLQLHRQDGYQLNYFAIA
ncbi:AGAP004972-PA-like protein [Anopheles sinensis]|uniref:AGAP004972-PA-like protein n=1 Tax=Anopheles sinensis TaxID=74873 RepID=A0A084VEB9_ANOSI|nr:AGAP004972-PA-like protein [Anopheles sinensis]